ncbi:E3 ubiquitin-protein ligase HUWE1 isoform X3 [Folsomia candida]|uniref:E3 ubiquitin-protein ligase HUWE1 isoform X3 n=1 Tax=Folsomia candida TaxID=158441 RepID=UPI000B8F45F0|nr:E3 ubiquitin-protein ligase HUWE1 isoform X3 [Folsomia candida]
MKIDRTKAKRGTTEVVRIPPECKGLIEKFKACNNVDKTIHCGTEHAVIQVLDSINIWTYGKCELYHFIDVLDLFDSILQKATVRNGTSWAMACDLHDASGPVLQECVKKICIFTSILIEHSFSRTVYNSMEHLAALLNSINLSVVLEVLHLLYMFSKRSNFLTRLSEDRRDVLLGRLALLAESWGGKEAGFGLAVCCLQTQLQDFPTTATTVHLEFAKVVAEPNVARWKQGDTWQVIHIENVHTLAGTPADILDDIVAQYQVPPEKQLVLFTHLRLAYNFPHWGQRVQLIQARLQALSILVYANAIQDNTQQLLYNGLMEELVDVLELDRSYLTEIKAAALKTLTSIIHLDRAQNFPSIIDATGAGSYHGFLPVMVRTCIASLTSCKPNELHTYPLSLATSLFSFLYHLASYELGGEALVNCGILESLLKVVNWNTVDVEQITFVTRAVRVIDLITNMDMQAFQAHNGLTSFVNRLEMEVNACRNDQPFEIVARHSFSNPQSSSSMSEIGGAGREDNADVPMDTDVSGSQTDLSSDLFVPNFLWRGNSSANFIPNGTTCLTQRAALLKSMLNFLKKVIQDPAFSDGIRHIMEGSLPGALKHIISNAEYYGASLFILATDIVTVYVFQEPSLLSTLQDSGLTDIVSEALLVKDVPPTREVIATMPNVFSALCLNNRGLHAFIKYQPFKKLFRMLISSDYLPAMRRRRTAEPMGDTASNLGNSVDELMRHQPSLRVVAMHSMVELLEELSNIGSSPRALAKTHYKPATLPIVNSTARSGASEGGSSEDEDDDDEETSTASHSQPVPSTSSSRDEVAADGTQSSSSNAEDKSPIPYMDYVLNVMKCLDAILSNNSTDDHCREFVRQGGLTVLMSILSKNTLPLDFPASPACQATASVCRSILTLAHEGLVLDRGIDAMLPIMNRTQKLNDPFPYPGSSVLLRELADSTNPAEAVNDPYETPALHGIISIHSMITMFIHVCRTGQTDIRTLVVKAWGNDQGIDLLKQLSQLYLNLVWESTVLLSLCGGEYQPGTVDFGKEDLEKLIPPEGLKEAEVSLTKTTEQMAVDPQAVSSSDLTAVTTPSESSSSTGMEVDPPAADVAQRVLVNSSTQTTMTSTHLQMKEISSATLQNYAKLIKPILSASSRLGRALTEFFGLLVKLCVGSPLRQRRGHHVPQVPGVIVPGAIPVATTLANLLTLALNWEPKMNSPVPRITFSICAVGFSAPLLFDEKKFPYHLMLRKFMEADGLDAIFRIFYRAMIPPMWSYTPGPLLINEHQLQFLESWLLLIEKFANPKTILDNQHLLQTKSLMLTQSPEFDANAFLAHIHKKSFDAIVHMLKQYGSKNLGVRSIESLLTILCYVFRFKRGQTKPGNQATSEATSSTKESKEVQTSEAVQPSTAPVVLTIPKVNAPSPATNQAGPLPGRPPRPIPPTGIIDPANISDSTPQAAFYHHGSIFPLGPALVPITAPHSLEPRPLPVPTPVVESEDDERVPALLTINELRNMEALRALGPLSSTEASVATALTILARPPEGVPPLPGGQIADANTQIVDRIDAAERLGVDLNHLEQLMEMGFPLEICVEALVTTSNIMLATDYLLSNARATVGGASSGSAGSSNSIARDNSTLPPTGSHERLTALLKLFTDKEKAKEAAKAAEAAAFSKSIFDNLESLTPEVIDDFATDVFELCMDILDKIPESVFRVCELLIAVGQRKGMLWLEETLWKIIKQSYNDIFLYVKLLEKGTDGLAPVTLGTGPKQFGYRMHLFSLLSDEMTFLCGMILEQSDIPNSIVRLIKYYERALNSATTEQLVASGIMKNGVLQSPPWLAPTFLLLDLYQKAVALSNRKYLLENDTDYRWKWFDINSGKWCPYSSTNNTVINKAFWDGDSTVRITAGRRRYVINFNAMIQLNEETSNRRPITLWLADPAPVLPSLQYLPTTNRRVGYSEKMTGIGPHPLVESEDVRPKDPDRHTFLGQGRGTTNSTEKQMRYTREKLEFFKTLLRDDVHDLVKCSVSFMKHPIEPEFLHALMRFCLRATRDHEVAVTFANAGGIQLVLDLTQNSNFPGVLPLSNLLIRHVIEDRGCLRYAVEKMIRAKVLSTGASTCKELHYLLRVLAPIACRCPDLFVSVAKEILQVDLNFVTRREEDLRLIVKAVPCKQESLITTMGDAAKNVIQQLLVTLTLNNPGDGDQQSSVNKEEEAAGKTSSQVKMINTDEMMDTDTNSKPVKDLGDVMKKRRLIPKDAICQLLAESVHSYSYSCKIIAEYNFQGGTSIHVTEDCTALAFLLDKMLPPGQTVSEKDCSIVVRDLISAMSGCNHLPDAQAIVVSEVKAALQRALAMKESVEKHNRIQALAGLICNMIEGCSSAPATQMVTIVKPTQLCMNQVVRLLIRKNVIVDLTRISHSLDLSSPQMAATINAALKPLEVISRIVNQPAPSNPHRVKPKAESAVLDSVNNTHTGGTSNSELTHAQGEETVEDADNTEHDISAAAESILDATSESHTHHDPAEEREDDVLDDIMDHLLERDANAHSDEQLFADALMADATSNRMETEQDGTAREDREFGERAGFNVDHGDNDTSDSDSEDSEGDDDEDDEDGNGNNVGEEEDDDDEEEEDDDDEEEDAVSTDDRDHDHMMDEGFMRFPGMDRDEDLLVVQYGHDENTPVFFTNNASYNFNVGLFDDPLISEHASGLRLNHPMLTPPVVDTPTIGPITARGHRAARNRRFQYIHLPRNPPPSIQRLLGPSTAQDAMQFTSGQSFNHGLGVQNPARVLMLDAAVDPTVARNGGSGNNSYLSNYTALHWWCEESKVLDGESMHDCVIALKRPIVETIETERDRAFAARREKKAEEAKKKVEAAGVAKNANNPEVVSISENSRPTNSTATTTTTTMDISTTTVATTTTTTATTTTAAPAASSGASTRVTPFENDSATTTNPSSSDTAETSNATASNFNSTFTPNNTEQTFMNNIPVIRYTASLRNVSRHVNDEGAASASTPNEEKDEDEHESDMDVTTEEPSEPPPPPPTTSATTTPTSAPATSSSPATSSTNSTGRPRSGRGTPGERRQGRRQGLRSSARLAAARTSEHNAIASPGSGRNPSSLSPQHGDGSSDTGTVVAGDTSANDDQSNESEELMPISSEAARDSDGLSPIPPLYDMRNENNVGEGEVAGPSGTQSIEDFRNVLGDIVIPDGVDPSFLAALPEEMRQEVISEHLRLQRLRPARAAPADVVEVVPVTDVSPEFLAALPPSIQEEVLAQQRLEQQRRVATTSNPNDPVDTEAFFRNLQPALRQAILTDMDESQIAVLPADLATEAQGLRREWESRNRQLLHERFFSHGYTAGSALSSILRNSGMRITSRYGLQTTIAGRPAWAQPWPRGPAAIAAQHMLMTSKIKGKQLVDNEALSCLLVLLFLDDPRLNTGRLHRVLRNLCYHANTRQWVIRSLLSVMERANECSRLPHQILALASSSSAIQIKEEPNVGSSNPSIPTSDKDNTTKQLVPISVTPSWLNLSLDAALGCRASVFEIHKSAITTGKKGGIENRIISIHAQAVPSISKHTLDVLSNLAKSFPTHFLPAKAKPSLYCHESSSKIYNLIERKPPTPPPEAKKAGASPGKKSDVPEFWEILLKLDSATSSRKGKHVAKAHANLNVTIDQGSPAVSFEASPFGQLINMLSYGCIRRSTLLTDKLLRLLSLISLGIPDTSGFGRKVLLEEPVHPQDASLLITESHLRLIVEVITSKNCTEEGLEEATSLLLNLSYGPPLVRDKILNLLMEGVRELGNVVCAHIASLQNELRSLRKEPLVSEAAAAAAAAAASSSSSAVAESDSQAGGHSSNSTAGSDPDDKPFKGTLMDRFTKDTVVIQPSSKNKAAYELQLPSMTALTSKTSSQSFFLRLLKVIISLRESIETAIKKYKMMSGPSATSSSLSGPLMSSTIMAGDRSLLQAVTAGMPESASRDFQAAFERVVNSSRIRLSEEQPMDVDQDPSDAGEAAPPAAAEPVRTTTGTNRGLEAMVDIDESSDEDDDDVVLPGDEDVPPLAPSNHPRGNVDVSKLLPRLSSLLDLEKLWETLSECLLELGHTPDHHAVLVLQPAVEAFFLVHASSVDKEEKNSTAESREAQLAHLQQDLPPVSPIEATSENRNLVDTEMTEASGFGMLDVTQQNSTIVSLDTQKFLKFAETHRTVLNQILRQSSSNLAEGPFCVLVDHTRVLDFDVKRRYFRNELERLDEGVRREDLAVHVTRSHVFEDSFRELHRKPSEEWKNRFYIVFEAEEGQDAGGLLREWYVIISREIFNPMYALFTISPGDRVTYMINQLSHCNSNHLFYFKFVGRVIAKAIYDNKLLECYFTRSFYKHILGKPVRYTDMESEDYSFYQGLAFLMENTVDELGYELTFSTEVQEFGVTEIRDLIPNGRNIPVTEVNKMEYIRLVCQMKMTGAIRKQLNAFLEGFYDIIPKRLISIFNEQELELLVSGLPNIDIEDLKANTEYHKYQVNSLQIQWFWRALRSFDQADRAKFLQFVTGTSKVPLQGFGALEGMNGVQKFQIHRDDRSTDRLPSAHTCFNQLDLPGYETYDKLRSYLLKAIHECSEGFGFA